MSLLRNFTGNTKICPNGRSMSWREAYVEQENEVELA